MKSKYVIFDLDDTLTYEIDYLKSAYKEIAIILDEDNKDRLYSEMIGLYENGKDIFEIVTRRYTSHSKIDLLSFYHHHKPSIKLSEEAREILNFCREKEYKLGLITDGRSITQRNKLKSLGIEEEFDKIIISEEFGSSKPDERNFKEFVENGITEYFYIADNPKKDFLVPNKLGWKSICLIDRGNNIHLQDFNLPEEYLPCCYIRCLREILPLLN